MIISKKIFEDLSSIPRQEIYQWISLVGSMEGKLFTSYVQSMLLKVFLFFLKVSETLKSEVNNVLVEMEQLGVMEKY